MACKTREQTIINTTRFWDRNLHFKVILVALKNKQAQTNYPLLFFEGE